MKVQCDVCESAAASVICCADEAALCLPCDERIHAANKLASKHQRLRLLYSHSSTSFATKGAAIDSSDADSSNPPMCDICQEKTAFIFCLEDRALLCRNCDISIHPANTLAAGHRRLLATGIRVSLNAMDPGQKPPCSPQSKPEEPRRQAATKNTSMPASDTATGASKPQPTTVPAKPPNEFMTSKRNVSNSSPVCNTVPAEPSSTCEAWQVDEVLSLPDLAAGYNLGDLVSEKADIASVGEYDWMADFSIFEEHIYTESLAEVPQIASIPNDLSLAGKAKIGHKGKLKQDISFLTTSDDAFVVPDMSVRSDEVLTVPLKRQKMLLPGIV